MPFIMKRYYTRHATNQNLTLHITNIKDICRHLYNIRKEYVATPSFIATHRERLMERKRKKYTRTYCNLKQFFFLLLPSSNTSRTFTFAIWSSIRKGKKLLHASLTVLPRYVISSQCHDVRRKHGAFEKISRDGNISLIIRDCILYYMHPRVVESEKKNVCIRGDLYYTLPCCIPRALNRLRGDSLFTLFFMQRGGYKSVRKNRGKKREKVNVRKKTPLFKCPRDPFSFVYETKWESSLLPPSLVDVASSRALS